MSSIALPSLAVASALPFEVEQSNVLSEVMA